MFVIHFLILQSLQKHVLIFFFQAGTMAIRI